MSKEQFKYTASFGFTAPIKKGSLKEAKASSHVFDNFDLTSLRSLLPDQEVIDENEDLLYAAFNAAVVNLINANDHGMDTETALEVSKYFVDRQLNIEHDRWNIIGHIISQGYSSFASKTELLTAEELKDSNEPFNICLGAVIYKPSREWMAEMLEESSDKDTPYYGEFSASWEIGYDEYHILKGSKKVKDAERISDPEEIAKLAPYLRMEGGSGFLEDGTPIYALIVGKARPLGCAITSNPAAAVKGLLAASKGKEKQKNVEEASKKIAELTEKLQLASAEILEIKTNFTELKEKEEKRKINSVIINNMKLTSLASLGEYLKSAEASVAEASIKEFLTEELRKEADKYSEQIKNIGTEKETVANELKTLKDSFEKLQNELEKNQNELKAQKEQQAFDIRMDEISNKFELTAEQLEAVANDIKGLDEAAYTAWNKKFALFAAKKEEKKTPDLSQSLASASAEAPKIPNAAAEIPPAEDEFAVIAAKIAKL